jgi:hypothetical protein
MEQTIISLFLFFDFELHRDWDGSPFLKNYYSFFF